jgi:aspartyl-tRNA(Asn)/glutamyl-tRNA(Gln) amidotransferase subunit B
MELEVIIGLEVHVQLKTKSKMFCSCDNRDEQAPNTAVCPVCSAQPGTLPVPNQQAIDWAVMTSAALGCTINQDSKFDRKSYFYPDLPKGYQISQYDKPFGVNGAVTVAVDGEQKTFRIHRLHLEEDAGKLLHPVGQEYSLVDLNRAGTPLMEIVSEPDFRSPAEAKAYVQELQLIMRYLGVSDADMEKGHLRCDANISLRPVGDTKLYPKTEIKNMNSFRSIERGLQYEIERQRALWDDGAAPTISATRGWDDAAGKTIEQRTKEAEADYRYFPEPDIPPITITDQHLQQILAGIPEIPAARRVRYAEQYALSPDTMNALVQEKLLGEYFEHVVSELQAYLSEEFGDLAATERWGKDGKKMAASAANWLVSRVPVEHRLEHGLPPAADTARLLWLVHEGVVNLQAAMTVYEKMLETKKGPHELVKELGLEQVSDTEELMQVVAGIIAANESVVAEIRAGKTVGVQFLIGQVMKQTKGKANPKVVGDVVKAALGL